MAGSTIFYIIKKSDRKMDEGEYLKRCESYKDEFFNKEKLLPKYLEDNSYESPYEYLIESNTKICWNILYPMHFISTFGFFGEALDLNAYNFERSTCEISFNDAKEILIAVKYLLGRKYSYEMEEILSNKWISIFGEILPEYLTGKMEKGTSFSYETQEGIAILNSVRLILESFMDIKNFFSGSEDIKLICVVHG